MQRNTARARARSEDPNILSLARSNSAAYFRVSAIDHPATDAPSILDFPTETGGERDKERAPGRRGASNTADRPARKNASILFSPRAYVYTARKKKKKRKEKGRNQEYLTSASLVDGVRRARCGGGPPSYRSPDQRWRAASPRAVAPARGSNLSNTRWARPGPEIIARSEI